MAVFMGELKDGLAKVGQTAVKVNLMAVLFGSHVYSAFRASSRIPACPFIYDDRRQCGRVYSNRLLLYLHRVCEKLKTEVGNFSVLAKRINSNIHRI